MSLYNLSAIDIVLTINISGLLIVIWAYSDVAASRDHHTAWNENQIFPGY